MGVENLEMAYIDLFPPNELKTRNDKTLWAHWCPKKWSTGMHHQPAIDLATTSFFQGFSTFKTKKGGFKNISRL